MHIDVAIIKTLDIVVSIMFSQSVLPKSGMCELADSIKFLTHFKWPTQLSLVHTARTLCAMLDTGTLPLHSKPTSLGNLSTCSTSGQVPDVEGRDKESHQEQNEWTSEQRSRLKWRESEITPEDLLRLVHMMRKGGIKPDRLD